MDLTGLGRATVARTLDEADGRSRVHGLFDDHWPEDETDAEKWDKDDLGAQRAASVRGDEGAIAAIMLLSGLGRTTVARTLEEADGRSRVHGLFEGHWPDAGTDSGDWDADELAGQRAAAVRGDEGAISAIMLLTGLGRIVVARTLEEADGRVRVDKLFWKHWPDAGRDGHIDELGKQRAASVRGDRGAISAIVKLTGLSWNAVASTLEHADGRSRVQGLFQDHWPDAGTEVEDWATDDLAVQRAAALPRSQPRQSPERSSSLPLCHRRQSGCYPP
jgi:hypothetical protein